MNRINTIILNSALELKKKVDAKAIIIYADLYDDLSELKKISSEAKIILLFQYKEIKNVDTDNIFSIQLPKVSLSRIGLIKISVMMSISAGHLSHDDKIICLSGLKEHGYLDSLVVLDLDKESEIIVSRDSCNITDQVKPEVFERILALSIELAKQGRENDPVGTIFVLGDHKNVLNRSKQLIINPFHGHPEHEKQVLNPHLRETIKEFSSIDGAFIIRGDGVILSAGRHLNTSLDAEELTPGLGCRHAAAAGITSQTKAVSIVISQSTGTVRIFKSGKVIMKVEKTVT
jgi:DNA integrity scanning protein DisA with diadenylate cyclase activity